jgi:hypothetical protein
MTTIRLEAIDVGNEVRLAGTRVRWPEGEVRASQADWGAGARTGPLLIFFARFKLWGLRGADTPFVLAGGHGSPAATLHNHLDNSGKPKHWTRRVFGTAPRDPSRCRLGELIEAPERGGQFVAQVVHDGLPPENVEIVWNRKELRTAPPEVAARPDRERASLRPGSRTTAGLLGWCGGGVRGSRGAAS